MTAGNGTGPAGMGPMTGRGMGYCAGYNAPGYANPGPGFGRGLGRGLRRGFGRGRFWDFAPRQPMPVQPIRPYPQTQQVPYSRKDELADLNAEKELLERDLKAIAERVKELEKGK